MPCHVDFCFFDVARLAAMMLRFCQRAAWRYMPRQRDATMLTPRVRQHGYVALRATAIAAAALRHCLFCYYAVALPWLRRLLLLRHAAQKARVFHATLIDYAMLMPGYDATPATPPLRYA